MRNVRQQLADLSESLDLLIQRYKIKNSVFKLPISHGEVEPVSMSCFLADRQQIFLSSKQIEEVAHFKAQEERWSNYNDADFYKMIELIFSTKDLVKEYYVGQRDFYVLQSTVMELLEILCVHIGYNRRVGKFPITEFAEQINEKVGFLEYEKDKELKDLILHDLDHLVFRLATYCGKNHTELFIHFDYLESSEYKEDNKVNKEEVQTNIDRDFWNKMLMFCDDYSEYDNE